MALTMKAIKTVGSAINKHLLTENTIANGGGFSSLLVPRKVNGRGALLATAGMFAISAGDTGLQARNRSKAGYISYGDGMARMTDSYTSGVIPAMKRQSGGNYGIFADMAEEVVSTPGIRGAIDDYGVTPAMISALYNMGGR